MKNYRTTIIGAALAGLSFLSIYQANGGNLAHWQQWVIPFVIAALGYVAKDAGVTGSLKILVGSLFLLTLPSCTTSNGTTLFAGLSKADWLLVTKDASSAALKSATQAGLTSYTTRRFTSVKNPINVLP